MIWYKDEETPFALLYPLRDEKQQPIKSSIQSIDINKFDISFANEYNRKISHYNRNSKNLLSPLQRGFKDYTDPIFPKLASKVCYHFPLIL